MGTLPSIIMKEKSKNAIVILAKCRKNKNTFGIRAEEKSRNFISFTWAFPIADSSAKREGYDQTGLSGSVEFDNDYPGCPYCKEANFVQCGKCKKLTCYAGDRTFTCAWCGNQGEVTTAESFDLSGGGF